MYISARHTNLSCFTKIQFLNHEIYSSPVHVVLVSLLVDQLSGLFLTFFGRPKKDLFSLRESLVRLWFFWSTKFLFGIPKFLFSIPKNQSLTKKIQRLTKNSLRLNKFFFLVDQKKWEIDRTIGRPRDWPKPHGRDYWATTRSKCANSLSRKT